MDRTIQQAEHCGAYTLLDLHWMNDDIPYGGDNFVPPLPNPESIEVWRLLAWRYRDRPSVLFDLSTSRTIRSSTIPTRWLPPTVSYCAAGKWESRNGAPGRSP